MSDPDTAPPRASAIVLDAYAARTCAVKTHNVFDPTVDLVPDPELTPIDEALQDLFDAGIEFEATIAARLAQVPGAVDLRGLEDQSHAVRVAACAEAVSAGAPVVLGASLPLDRDGHRTGRVDVLVRGADRADGRPGYHPVEIKNHRAVERRRPGTESPALQHATLDAPMRLTEMSGARFRFGTRESDLLQVAHYWRMLQACGYDAPGTAWGGVIGNDPYAPALGVEQPSIAWVDLAAPVTRTFSRTSEQGWTRRSILQRYDHEFEFRLDVARIARQQGDPQARPPMVHPIVIDECRRCQWWQYCRAQIPADDLSVKLDKGPLDVREISMLRRLGVRTVTDLAAADLATLLPQYLAEVRHRDNAESRVTNAHRRAVMLAQGRTLERISTGPVELPTAAMEIDFDLESAADGRVYLWGFLVNDASGSRYQPFVAWQDLDEAGEVALAVEALTWLRTMVRTHGATVHHYSGYEISQLQRLAALTDHEAVQWSVTEASPAFVDLYEVVKQHWFGVHGLGLKQVADVGAGFTWRDDDPSGLSSQSWFFDAVHADGAGARAEARQRVLDYNEDDVIATREVRAWLRRAPQPPSAASAPGGHVGR